MHNIVDVPKSGTDNGAFFYNISMADLVRNISSNSRGKSWKEMNIRFGHARSQNSKSPEEWLAGTQVKHRVPRGRKLAPIAIIPKSQRDSER
jgi:hypothetical protein